MSKLLQLPLVDSIHHSPVTLSGLVTDEDRQRPTDNYLSFVNPLPDWSRIKATKQIHCTFDRHFMNFLLRRNCDGQAGLPNFNKTNNNKHIKEKLCNLLCYRYHHKNFR